MTMPHDLHPHQILARQAINTYLQKGEVIEPPTDLPPEFSTKRAGTFVSLHTADNSLRSCIGTFLPVCENLAQEIIRNAIAAATEDPRFAPVQIEEVKNLKISVDVLSTPEKTTLENLNPQKYGVIVSTSDGRRGLLLPDLPEVDTVEYQLSIACQKAGIDFENEKFAVERFTVERFGEK